MGSTCILLMMVFSAVFIPELGQLHETSMGFLDSRYFKCTLCMRGVGRVPAVGALVSLHACLYWGGSAQGVMTEDGYLGYWTAGSVS